MPRFTRHYTREEAIALLPHIRTWLARLRLLHPVLEEHERVLIPRLAEGRDLGGSRVNAWVRTWITVQAAHQAFHVRQIQLRDLDRGLVDFPARFGDREVFLCWQEGEESIEFWHELDAGIAGRTPL